MTRIEVRHATTPDEALDLERALTRTLQPRHCALIARHKSYKVVDPAEEESTTLDGVLDKLPTLPARRKYTVKPSP